MNDYELNSLIDSETSEEVDQALGLTSLEKKVEKKLKEKQDKDDFVYRFNYVDLKNKICVNTMVSVDPKTGAKTPTFVKWNGESYELCKEFKTIDGLLIKVPPIIDQFYRGFYDDIIFPDTIIEDLVPTDIIDQKITEFLKAWHAHPDDYFVIARNYIKFTWVYERFYRRPYLLIFGDYGTGKTEWGKFITQLCQNGLITDDISAPSLARILEMTGSTVMLDELDKIDYRQDSEKMNTILRNGYREGGHYIVAEQEGKKFKPSSFRVDQPKILVKRNMIRDDALASRVIPFKLTPRDKDLQDVMRRNDESWWHNERRLEFQVIVNLLLKWRWQNIFLEDRILIVPGMIARFNDTIMPLLKMGNLEDRVVMIDYMRKQEKVAIDSASDEQRIQIIRLIFNLTEAVRENNLLGSPAARISLTEIINEAKSSFGSDMSDFDFKKTWNPKRIKRDLMDLGFEVERYQNKSYIKLGSLADLLPRLLEKYNIRAEVEVPVDNSVDKDIDTDMDKSNIDNNKPF